MNTDTRADRLQPHRTTGSVGESGPVAFTACNREQTTTPALCRMAMTVPLAFDDIVAALFILTRDAPGTPLAELVADDAYVHEMVLETVLAEGALALGNARYEITCTTDPRERVLIDALRAITARLYGTPPPTAPNHPTSTALTQQAHVPAGVG